jgi:hypothetical protein
MNTFKNKTTAVVNEALKRRWNIKTDEGVMAMIDNSGILTHEEIHKAAREIKAMFQKSTPTKEEKIMKESFVTLKDRKNRSRVIISMVETDGDISYNSYVYVGMAIRSADDRHSDKYGQRLARARAIRAMKGRKPCYVTRDEAIENLQSLCFKDFKRLMFFTNGLVKNFKKGVLFRIGNIKSLRKELYNATKTA